MVLDGNFKLRRLRCVAESTEDDISDQNHGLCINTPERNSYYCEKHKSLTKTYEDHQGHYLIIFTQNQDF